MPNENELFHSDIKGRVGTSASAEHDMEPVTSAPGAAPAGSGGTGFFIHPGPLGGQDFEPENAGDVTAPVAAKATAPNPPPATNPRSLGEKSKSNTAFHDVLVDASVVADGKVTTADLDAETSFDFPTFTVPGYDTDGAGEITKFNGKFKWRGTITIQTVYGPKASAKDLSCYGRGTTPKDRQNGDITLGFHESCHRDDYANYLKDHPLPTPLKMQIGMTTKQYADEDARFRKEFKAYQDAMKLDSKTNTDEVGHKLSTVLKTNQCYVHQVP